MAASSPFFNDQLTRYIGKTVQVATNSTLVEGILVRVQNGVIEVSESTSGYETETRLSIIPISSINYVRVNA